MTRDERVSLYREIRVAIKSGAAVPTILSMLDQLPNDSEKSKYFREKLKEMI